MFKGTNKFGFTNLKVADGLLELLKDYLTGRFITTNMEVVGSSRQRPLILAISDSKWNDFCQACC